jgi:CheY-like chemotaxis protein
MPPSNSPESKSYRILVIDDSRDAAYTLKMLLGKIGHEVETADSGKSGIEAAARFSPHIVLCDIGMPDLDGYQVARVLRAAEAKRQAYLVALTGYGQDEDRLRALESGFDQHLTKPVSLSTLQAMIAAVERG